MPLKSKPSTAGYASMDAETPRPARVLASIGFTPGGDDAHEQLAQHGGGHVDGWRGEAPTGSPVASMTAARIVAGGSGTGSADASGAVAGRSGRNLIGRSFCVRVGDGRTSSSRCGDPVGLVKPHIVSPVLRGCYRAAKPARVVTASTLAGESTCCVTMIAAPSTPAVSPACDCTMPRCCVASGIERR